VITAESAAASRGRKFRLTPVAPTNSSVSAAPASGTPSERAMRTVPTPVVPFTWRRATSHR